MTNGLFGKLSEHVSYPRLYFTATDADFDTIGTIPADARLTSDEVVLSQLVGIGSSSIAWVDIAATASLLIAATRRRAEDFIVG